MEGLALVEVAERFGISQRTARRWLEKCDLYNPRSGYGPGKISETQAAEIRVARKAGVAVKDLASKYGVTQATIYRIANGETHIVSKDTAIVSVIYNPDVSTARSE